MHSLTILTVLVQFVFINRAVALANDSISGLPSLQNSLALGLDIAPHVLRLTRREPSRPIKRNQQTPEVLPPGVLDLTTTGGSEYETEISSGNQTFKVIVDTGSSVTWLMATGFHCVDEDDATPEPQEDCTVSATYDVTEAFEPELGHPFDLKYADNSWVNGTLGYANITIAGLTVCQEIGLATTVSEHIGIGDISGLLALAYIPPTEQTSDAGDPSQGPSNQDGSIFYTLVKENLTQPMFSLAIERDDSGGYLAFGGLPPVPFVDRFITTPILSASDFLIKVDGVEYSDSAKHVTVVDKWRNLPAYVDSGSTSIYLPPEIAAAVNSRFNPPAEYYRGGLYLIECDAKPPHFAVTINGQNFWIDPQDLIRRGRNTCWSGILHSANGLPNLLGDVFLKNVIAVFDVGAREMRFAPREVRNY